MVTNEINKLSTDLLRDLEVHRERMLAFAVGGLVALTLSLAMLLAGGEGAAVLVGAVGAWLMMTAISRAWALGGWRLDRWKNAEESIWRVESVEEETDSENDTAWVYLTVLPIRGSANAPRLPRNLTVCISPPGMSRASWKGKELTLLRAADRKQLIRIQDECRFYRADGSGPWDWLV